VFFAFNYSVSSHLVSHTTFFHLPTHSQAKDPTQAGAEFSTCILIAEAEPVRVWCVCALPLVARFLVFA
jgi:hypothetical protein